MRDDEFPVLPSAARRTRWRRGGTPRVAAPSLVLFGLVLGLAGALFYAWVLNPIVYSQATPAQLGAEYQSEYIYLVSESYAVDGNWTAARQRLAALRQPDVAAVVGAELDAALRQGKSPQVVRDLAALAAQLGVQGRAVALFAPAATPTPQPTSIVPTFTPTLLPTLTPTPPPTATPRPSATPTETPVPTETPAPAYRLLSQRRACRFDQPVDWIEVMVLDGALEPVPGVEVLVMWEGGADHFFTGFKPDEGPGYGDFTMGTVADVSYSVTLAEGSPPVSGLRPRRCESRDGGLMGGWRLTFQRLTPPQP